MYPVPPERMPGERKLVGNGEYEQALDELLAQAAQTVRIFDRALGRGFNSPHRHELLRRRLLARRTNRVCIVLHETGNLARDCPRLMMLVRQFGHALVIRRTLHTARHVYDPFAIADDARFVRRFHHDHMRSVATIGDVAETSLLLKRFAEIWEASSPVACATTAGL